ncbi:MAG: imidazoleglycerol-phosphate dehydratase HisB [Spirochaetes bacterium]|nr:imidazoleglycerol-phosphate dehydratase HisB [Spirochaetota bacterium]
MRTAAITRNTSETQITLKLNLDGTGKASISTGIPFFDHMLNSFSKHSLIDLDLDVKGDLDVDFHHTIEDTGIVLGQALTQALGDKKGIERFADATVPLDEALSRAVVDLSGRPYLHYEVSFSQGDDGSQFAPQLFEEFFRAFTVQGGLNLHIDLIRGKNSHHILEAIFKATARACKQAVTITGKDIPSTKGVI